MNKNTVKAEEMVSKTSASMTANFAVVGVSDHALFLLRIINATNEDISISYDGLNAHEYLIAGQTLQINTQQNALPNGNVALFKNDFTVWVKGTAGAGNVYLAGYYQDTVV